MTARSFTEPASALQPRSPVLREFVLYLACSAIALGVDTGLYALGLKAGMGYPVCAVIGFMAGLGTAYGLSVRFAFQQRSLRSARLEFAIFAAVGVVGLGLTELLLWVQIEGLGRSALFAKVGAAGGVFLFNFVVRKVLLFSHRKPSVVGAIA